MLRLFLGTLRFALIRFLPVSVLNQICPSECKVEKADPAAKFPGKKARGIVIGQLAIEAGIESDRREEDHAAFHQRTQTTSLARYTPG
jgi:hypothetical protein